VKDKSLLTPNVDLIPHIKTVTFFYYSDNGDDKNPGTKQRPLKTLKRAKALIQEYRIKNYKLVKI